jgi:hypothetical protein
MWIMKCSSFIEYDIWIAPSEMPNICNNPNHSSIAKSIKIWREIKKGFKSVWRPKIPLGGVIPPEAERTSNLH